MSTTPTTPAESLPNIAFEIVPAETVDGYITWNTVPEGTYSFTVVEPDQMPEETVIVEAEGIQGVQIMPGTDLELLYGKPTIWDSPWFVGGLMTLGVLLILGAVQAILHRSKQRKKRQQAAVIEPTVPAVTVVTADGQPVQTPIAGTVTKLHVMPGQPVQKGQPLCVMETWLAAPEAGVVTQVSVPEGTVVGSGTPLFVIKQ